MGTGEIQYTFRKTVPNVLQRGRTQVITLEAYRDGVLVAPTVAGSSFQLLGPDGTAQVGPKDITVVDEIATVQILATEIPDDDTTELSELYQGRWALVMPDGTTRTVRREAAIARFLFHPNVADIDLIEGEYPDLLTFLGDEHGKTVQPFIDAATRHVLRKLWASGQWPDLMLTSDAFYEPIRQFALFRIFKWLFRLVPGNNRWERLMDHHDSEFNKAWTAFTSRIDYDHDGLADDRGRRAASTVIHKNAGPFRNIRRTARW